MSDGARPAPGDIVELLSGGPDLTVLRVYSDVDGIVGDRVADLGWFTAVGEYRTGTLPLAVLRSRGGVEPPSPPSKPQRTGYRDLKSGEYHECALCAIEYRAWAERDPAIGSR